jgi:predicted MFS family arabinose efflux permease
MRLPPGLLPGRRVPWSIVLGSRLDDAYGVEVRAGVAPLTLAKITANSSVRFAPPFLATLASGLHVSLATLGTAVAVSEGVGLTAPVIGRLSGGRPRPTVMAAGLCGIGAGALVIASSRGAWQFGAGLALIALSKILFDLNVVAWITDRVSYGRVARVIGLTETAWALSMLTGVAVMGLLTGLTSWRWAYVFIAACVVVMAVIVRSRLPMEARPSAVRTVRAVRVRGRLGFGWWVVGATVALTAAAQAVFVTFGTWLQDDFGFSDTALSGIIFGLGLLELTATSTTVRFTDAWGKQRSTMIGASLIVPCGLGLAALHGHLALGAVLLALYIGAFEFAIVSSMSLASSLVPTNPTAGLAMVVSGATLGRALMAPVATAAFSAHGMWLDATIGASCAAVSLACHMRFRRVRARRTAE